MRTSFLSQGGQTLLQLRAAASRRAKAGAELSSGLRVRQPSDAPAAAAAIVSTRSELSGIAQFKTNLEDVQAELRTVDGALFSAVNAVQRGLTLATQAANGTQTAATRKGIAAEIEGVFRHLAAIGNTVHGGRFVFAGASNAAPPFVIDQAAAAGIRYQGDSVQRSIRFPDGRPAPIALTGDEVFLTPESFRGSGRAPALSGASPSPPVGLGVVFSGDVDAVLSIDLPGFFVAPSAPSGAAAGDQVAVTFTSEDSAINETVSATLAGGENAAQMAALLNSSIALNSNLTGLVSFSDEGGALKLTVSDSAGQGFSFSSISTGSVTSGLEAGGSAGGYSAEEIAARLNIAVQADGALSGAGILFRAVDGEIEVDGNADFTFTAVDFDRGTEFVSGLAGTHRVGGSNSANVFGALNRLIDDLKSNKEADLAQDVVDLQRAVDHISAAQGFYGSTLRQVEVTLDGLSSLESVNQQRLSLNQDADLLEAIGALQSATAAEEFALQVASRQRPTLLDVIG